MGDFDQGGYGAAEGFKAYNSAVGSLLVLKEDFEVLSGLDTSFDHKRVVLLHHVEDEVRVDGGGCLLALDLCLSVLVVLASGLIFGCGSRLH